MQSLQNSVTSSIDQILILEGNSVKRKQWQIDFPS